MTDYFPLIARAVEGLDNNTGDARRALYERARTALVSQLRSVEPALPETEITKERLALEDAIRKVEADAARKARAELRESRIAPAPRSEPPTPRLNTDTAGATEAARRDALPLTARERLLNARTSSAGREGIRGFRDVVSEVHDLGSATAKAAQAARDTRDSYGPAAAPHWRDERSAPLSGHNDAHFDADETSDGAHDMAQLESLEPSSAFAEQWAAPPARPQQPPYAAATAEEADQRPPRSYRGLVQILVALIVLAGIGATISWQWPNIAGVYQRFAHNGAKPSAPPAAQTSQPKFAGRVPQDQGAATAPGAGTAGNQAAPAVAQRVVLYEEDPNDPQGKRSIGSVIWRTETVSPGPGLAPELAIRADLEIPDRRMAVTWSLRRNTDQALPASHTIEIMFKLPPDFGGGGIANVPGILMKQSEQARGTPLAGLAVKVTNGFFLVGLASTEADMQRNIQLLKERPWFDIPIVYVSGGRAILAMEKGPPGDQAFAEAFAAWEKK